MSAEYQREWRKANPDKCRKHQRDAYAKSANIRAYRKKYSAAYRIKNAKKLKDYRDKYYQEHKKDFFERAWNRIHYRRALKNGGLSEHYTKEQVYERYGGICIVCDLGIDLVHKYPHRESFTVHHIIPLSKGGDDTIKNVAPAHWKCNLAVGNKVPIAVRPLVYNV